MTIASLLPDPLARDAKAISGKGHSLPARDILAGIIKRSAGNQSLPAPDWLDPKRLVERAIEIDADEPGSPLTEGQWDYGLDMLAREEAPAEAGLALRQERIIVALSKALAETKGEDNPRTFAQSVDLGPSISMPTRPGARGSQSAHDSELAVAQRA